VKSGEELQLNNDAQDVVEWLHSLPLSNTWHVESVVENLYLDGVEQSLLDKVKVLSETITGFIITSFIPFSFRN
jgi:hypothetical protein